MNKTVITTDSGCNPRNMDYMLPCIVVDSNEKNYYDMKKISNDDIPVINNLEVFDRAVSGERFHTASPNIGDYISVMTPILEEGNNIIHLSMSNGISAGSVNASRVASDMLNDEYGKDRVTVIDTLTAGCGGTIINDYANDLLDKGYSTKSIIEKLKQVKEKIQATFFISKVEGFVNSGRAPHIAILSDKLSLRFRVDINDKGKLYPKLPPYKGSITKQAMKYVKSVVNEENKNNYDPNYITLLITKLKEIDLNEIKEYLISLNYFKKELIKELPFYSAISSYGVMDQVGIGLIKK